MQNTQITEASSSIVFQRNMEGENDIEVFPYPVSIIRKDFQIADSKEFKVDEYLCKNCRFTSLDNLIYDLTSLAESLNKELLDLVNGEYQNFIKLSQLIDGSLGLIHKIQVDLRNFRANLDKTYSTFNSSHRTADEALELRTHLIIKQSKAKLIISLEEQVNYFEVLLSREDMRTSDKLQNLTKLYLSFSSIYRILATETNSFLRKLLEPKVLSLKYEFESYLDEILYRHRISKKHDVMLQLLNIYKILGRERHFISIISKQKQ